MHVVKVQKGFMQCYEIVNHGLGNDIVIQFYDGQETRAVVEIDDCADSPVELGIDLDSPHIIAPTTLFARAGMMLRELKERLYEPDFWQERDKEMPMRFRR